MMTGVMKIEIAESAEDLKDVMNKQDNALNFSKVQSLYLLKIKATETVRYLSVLVGRSERTVHRWLSVYKEGGLEALLKEPEQLGRPKKVSVEKSAI